MKRRGFLGLLAALPAALLFKFTKAEALPLPAGTKVYHGIDTAGPGGDESVVTVWSRDPRFTDSHAWYLVDVCRGDPVTGCCMEHGSACSNVNVIRTFHRSRLHEDDLLPHRLRSKIEESWPTLRIPPKRAGLPDMSKYFASKDTWWPLP